MSSLLGAVLLSSNPAEACGGFACDAAPVLQAAERIVFVIDEEQDEVEMHVEVTYDGADDFAWIVPVPEVPELLLSTSALFNQMPLATNPVFSLIDREEDCRTPGNGLFGMGGSSSAPMAMAESDSSGAFDVTVANIERVGPYETVTLRGETAEDVLGWLASVGYDLDARYVPLLDPYLSAGGWFVALRLATQQTSGQLAPIALKFPADKGSIPVQLTSIAATPDMRMEVYVFSDGRAVPESYYHVRINDAAIDWWNGAWNYDDVITSAANEAGGHAFATDYHGDAAIAGDYFTGEFPEAALLEMNGDRWLNEVRSILSDVVPTELFPVLEQAYGLPPGMGATFWSCPDCVTTDGRPFDAAEATENLKVMVVEPLQNAQAMVDRFPYLTRMTSSLDAVEMTVDPVFVVNQDMADQEIQTTRTATQIWLCHGDTRDESERLLVLADGRGIEIPSPEWLRGANMTELQYIAGLGEITAQIIEETGAEGDPTVVVDQTSELFRLTSLHNGLFASGGCSSGPGAAGVLGIGLAAAALRRRRSG